MNHDVQVSIKDIKSEHSSWKKEEIWGTSSTGEGELLAQLVTEVKQRGILLYLESCLM